MCQSQAGNSNGAERFCDQINHLSTEEWHFLAIRQLPNCFVTSFCYEAIRKSLRIDQKLTFEGKIPGASTQVLCAWLGWPVVVLSGIFKWEFPKLSCFPYTAMETTFPIQSRSIS